jgi:hypothetical protein
MTWIDATNSRLKIQPAILSLLLLAGWGASPALAQSIMRSPSLNISTRAPNIGAISHIDPNLAGRGVTGLNSESLRIRPPCTAAERDSGNCSGLTATSNNNNGNKNGAGRGSASPSLKSRAVANEIVAEIDGTLSDAQADALARRHGLRRIETRSFELIGVTIGLFRIAGGKTVEAVSRAFAREASVRSFSQTSAMPFKAKMLLQATATPRNMRLRNCTSQRRTRLLTAPMSRSL